MSCCLFALAFVRSCLVCLTCDVWIKRIHQIGTNLAAKTEQPTALCRPRLYSWHFDGVCKRRCRKRFSSLSNPWSLFFSDFSSFWMSKWSCVCVKWWTTIRNGIKLPLILSTSKLSTRDTSFSPQNVHLFRSCFGREALCLWCDASECEIFSAHSRGINTEDHAGQFWSSKTLSGTVRTSWHWKIDAC